MKEAVEHESVWLFSFTAFLVFYICTKLILLILHKNNAK